MDEPLPELPKGITIPEFNYHPEISLSRVVIEIDNIESLNSTPEWFILIIEKLGNQKFELTKLEKQLFKKLLEDAPKTGDASNPTNIDINPLLQHNNLIVRIANKSHNFVELIRTNYINRHKEFTISEGLSNFIPQNGSKIYSSTIENDDNPQKLHDNFIIPFLQNSSENIFLLLGDSGSGKSLYLHYLENQCWINYEKRESNKNSLLQWIPIYIDLKQIKLKFQKDTLDAFLEEKISSILGLGQFKLSVTELKKLPILFLFDGYDEKQGKDYNLYQENHINDWNAKVIISSRAQYLQNKSHYEAWFKSSNNQLSCNEVYILPFSRQQIRLFIKGYQFNLNQTIVPVDIFEQFHTLYGLSQNPLLLRLICEGFNEIEKLLMQKDYSLIGHYSLRITKSMIYQNSINAWFNREAERLINLSGKQEFELWEFGSLESREAFNAYCQELAFQILEEKIPDTGVEYREIKATAANRRTIQKIKNPHVDKWRKFFSSKDEDIKKIRMGCPIRYQLEKYSFYHTSFMEYFAALNIFNGLLDNDSLTINIQEIDLIEILLNKILITQEYEIMQFLADMLENNESRIQRLFHIILASRPPELDKQFNGEKVIRQGKKLSIAAANAITILNRARICFSEMNLDDISIPGADLSKGILDHSSLQRANLKRANLQGAWLSDLKLNSAKLEGIQFGEIPYLNLDDPVNACCYSPDGKWLAVTCQDKIHLFDEYTMKRKKVLAFNGFLEIGPHKSIKSYEYIQENFYIFDMGEVYIIGFSSDSRYLLSAGQDPTVRLWDVNSGEIFKAFKGSSGNILGATISHDDECVAAGFSDGTILVWSIMTESVIHVRAGNITRTLFHFEDNIKLYVNELALSTDEFYSPIIGITMSRNGKYLATITKKMGKIYLWDLTKKELAETLNVCEVIPMCDVAFSPNDKYLAACTANGLLAVFHIGTNKLSRLHDSGNSSITCISFSPDSKYIAVGNINGHICLYDLSIQRVIQRFESHFKLVTGISFFPSGEKFASSSLDKTVRICEVKKNLTYNSNTGHSGSIHNILFSQIHQLIFSVGNDELLAWDIKSGKLIYRLKNERLSIITSCLDEFGKWIVTNSEFGAFVWKIDTGQPAYRIGFNEFKEKIKFVVNPDHKKFKWSNFLEPSMLNKIYPSYANTCSVAIDLLGKCIAIGGKNGIIYLCEFQEGKYLRVNGHSACVSSLAFHPKEKFIASGSYDFSIKLWSTETGELKSVWEGHSAEIFKICFSRDGLLAVSSDYNKTICVWSVNTGKIIHTLNEHESPVCSVAICQNSRILASGELDGTVRLWDLHTGNCIYTLQNFSSGEINICWASDNKNTFLITGGRDKSLRCWLVSNFNSDTPLTVLLQWSTHQEALFSNNINLDNATGLNEKAIFFLKQTHVDKDKNSKTGDNIHLSISKSHSSEKNRNFNETVSSGSTDQLFKGMFAQVVRENEDLMNALKKNYNLADVSIEETPSLFQNRNFSFNKTTSNTKGINAINYQTSQSVPECVNSIDENQRTQLPRPQLPPRGKERVLNSFPNFSVNSINRKGLTSIPLEELKKLSVLPDNLILGTAVDDGGCFFDGLAQALNIIQNTNKYTEIFLREMCYAFYSENKEEVNEWIKKDYKGINQGNNYIFVRYTKKELDTYFDGRAPIWGRQHIEGIILCRTLNLSAIHVIELLVNPENDQPIVVHSLITKNGVNPIKDGDVSPYRDNIPVLVLGQKDLHFIPILPKTEKSNALEHYSKAQENEINKPKSLESYPEHVSKQRFFDRSEKNRNFNETVFSSSTDQLFKGMFAQPDRENENLMDVLKKNYNLADISQISLEKAFRQAAANNRLKDLKFLLTQVNKIDAQDNNPKSLKTALHWAVKKGFIECARTLVEAGARTDIKDANQKTAKDYAEESNNKSILAMLKPYSKISF